jgi:excisionase family DNA binding protein
MVGEEIGVEEAAAILGIAAGSVRYLIRTEQLPARRVGQRLWLIPRDDVEAHALLMRDRQRPGPKPHTPRRPATE